MPYYCVSAWGAQIFCGVFDRRRRNAAADGYFNGFISGETAPLVFTIIYLALTAYVVFRGVEKGIESFSKIVMPLLLLLIVAIAVFSVTIHYTDEGGVTRTGLDGLLIYLIPNFDGITLQRFFSVLVDAMGQLFSV